MAYKGEPGSFRLQVTVPARPETIFRIFESPALTREWLFGILGVECLAFDRDFRTGGLEYSSFGFGPEHVMSLETEFAEIVPGRRVRMRQAAAVNGVTDNLCDSTMAFTPALGGTRIDFTAEMRLYDPTDHLQKQIDMSRYRLNQLFHFAGRLEDEPLRMMRA